MLLLNREVNGFNIIVLIISFGGQIYAIGDVLNEKPELTPVAIQAGLLLARRMCGVSEKKVKKLK